MLNIESYISTFARLGSNHKPTKPRDLKLFCICLILRPYHHPTNHSTALLPMLHIESSISTSVRLLPNHKPTKSQDLKLFCMCVIFGQAYNTALLPMLYTGSSIYTSARKGPNHKPTKLQNVKLFCMCLILRPYHKPTNHNTALQPMLTIESSISTSVKTTRYKTCLQVCHIWTITQAHNSAFLSICYTLRVLFIPLSDWDQTTSPQNQGI
jgi:hypothetical protein